jgi:hypothetical protein
MKNLKNLFLGALVLGTTLLTGCLHIIEEATFRNNGSGSYKMTIDMGEVKGMMDMMKGMGGETPEGDSTAIVGEEPTIAPAADDNSMAQMGEQLSSVSASLKAVQGITNVVEQNDTTNLQFGYSFDFQDVAALNRALRIINKEKYDSKTEEIFKFNGKNFERLAVGDIGAELKKALAQGGEENEEAESGLEMMKMFFADMSYKQVYNFPDRIVKKSDNKIGEISSDKHTLTINLKPFDEEQQKQKVSVATKVKLK